MTFTNSILAGETLVRGAIQSENYLAATQGWRIERDGDAEFNSTTVRGTLYVTDPPGGPATLAQIFMFANHTGPHIDLTSDDGDSYSISASNAGLHIENTSGSGSSTLWVVAGQGIALIQDGGTAGVLFDDSDGFLKRGTFDGTNWTVATWSDVSLQNGWTHTGGANANVSYRRMPDGTVVIRGAASAGTTTGGTLLFTLPAGFRPVDEQIFHIIADGSADAEKRIRIQTDGTVHLFNAVGTSGIRFAGIRFPLF